MTVNINQRYKKKLRIPPKIDIYYFKGDKLPRTSLFLCFTANTEVSKLTDSKRRTKQTTQLCLLFFFLHHLFISRSALEFQGGVSDAAQSRLSIFTSTWGLNLQLQTVLHSLCPLFLFLFLFYYKQFLTSGYMIHLRQKKLTNKAQTRFILPMQLEEFLFISEWVTSAALFGLHVTSALKKITVQS